MKFTSIATGRYQLGKGLEARKAYTLFALGEDGLVYRYLYRGKGQSGWEAIPDTIFLPIRNEKTKVAPSEEAISDPD